MPDHLPHLPAPARRRELVANQLVADLCARGDVVEYREYPGADHNLVVEASAKDLVRWLDRRRDGQPGRQDCQDLSGMDDFGVGATASVR